ncbi:conserved hypothetical protein [Leptospira interrogans serovar Manilae]|uniref:Uncharacterized protein n=3 Tax=Leptospira interrogans TaxID=173 RepID=A0AAQ1P064_LEPIR|nr:conserved hypothetical protein [Leptospira interrogans serovar Copenhageni str. Fiocruz L1-130]KWV26508.1 hypothetical protein LA733_0632 [Leptospira interrogans]KWV26924.1 hypothetical protein LA702_2057 [Leptospira interrogans]SOR61413.1 conserved hypothetical protein [Leptospira interrogans serovar Manilae]
MRFLLDSNHRTRIRCRNLIYKIIVLRSYKLVFGAIEFKKNRFEILKIQKDFLFKNFKDCWNQNG